MADYKKSELIAWMSEETRRMKWGMIFALDHRMLNVLLLEDYVRRFNSDFYLPSISGVISTVGDQTRWFALDNVTFDYPRIAFEQLNLTDSTARLRMGLISGRQIVIKGNASAWWVTEIRQSSLLNSPQLSLRLDLEGVPGEVGKDDNLYLDLSNSSDFNFTGAGDEDTQRLVGNFIKFKFEALPDHQRRFILGTIRRSNSSFVRPAGFALRTQPRQRNAEDEKGAALIFMNLFDEPQGDFPGSNSDFRYLLPSDADYRGAILTSHAVMMIECIQQALNGLGDGGVTLALDAIDDGTLYTSGRGQIVLPERHVRQEYPVQVDNRTVNMICEYDILPITIPTGPSLTVEADPRSNRLMFNWTLKGAVTVQMRSIDSKDGSLAPLLKLFNFDMTEFYAPQSDSFEYVILAYYSLRRREGVHELELENSIFHFEEIKAPAPPIGEIRPPSARDGETQVDFDYLIELVIALLVGLTATIKATIEAMFKMVDGAAIPSFELGFREQFEQNFQTSQVLNDAVTSVVSLNAGFLFIAHETHMMADIAAWGGPLDDVFIVPSEPLMAAGATLQLGMSNGADYDWKVEPILDSLQAGQVGTIDATGLYRAPLAADFDGPLLRVRVKAMYPDFDWAAAQTLVTVVKRTLEVDPLVSVIKAGDIAALQAGYLGDPGNLRWSLADPAQGGKLAGDGKAVTYTAPTRLPPAGSGGEAAFMIDTVLLQGSTNSPTEKSLLIVERASGGAMTVTADIDEANGTVALTAYPNGNPFEPDLVQWAVRHGSGSINASTGVYTHDPASQAPFAVLTATIDGGVLGLFEGYVIQTLPPRKLLQ